MVSLVVDALPSLPPDARQFRIAYSLQNDWLTIFPQLSRMAQPQPQGIPLDRPQRLTVLASRLSRTIGIARALAQNGRTVDLTGLDDGIGMLCAQTLDLPVQEGRALLPLLADVLQQVNTLTAALHEAQDAQAPRT